MRNPVDLKAIANADRLPRAVLHPQIVSRVWSAFMRGDYDTSVFQAFKAIEVAVREAAKLAEKDVGTRLMGKAFGPNGALRDPVSEVSEEDALANLFIGAMGFCKNPTSHRDVDAEQEETIELICFASLLMRIVDDRRLLITAQ